MALLTDPSALIALRQLASMYCCSPIDLPWSWSSPMPPSGTGKGDDGDDTRPRMSVENEAKNRRGVGCFHAGSPGLEMRCQGCGLHAAGSGWFMVVASVMGTMPSFGGGADESGDDTAWLRMTMAAIPLRRRWPVSTEAAGSGGLKRRIHLNGTRHGRADP